MTNPPIRSLFRVCDVTCCDNDAGLYEWDHLSRQYKLLINGPVMLTLWDRKPLHPMHARMTLEYVEEHADLAFEEYHVKRRRWGKRIDAGEYRDKINEMRGNVEAMAKEAKMRSRWEDFKEQSKEDCASVDSPWDV